MFKRILVPIDGSRASMLGLDQAIRLAKEQDAIVCLLHIVDELIVMQGLDSGLYTPAAYTNELLDLLRKAGSKLLAKAQKKVEAAGVTVEIAMIETSGQRVADVIVAQCRKRRSDLIVLGTHGRRGLRRLVMGSDAEGVLRTTRVPVLLVRGPDAASARQPSKRR